MALMNCESVEEWHPGQRTRTEADGSLVLELPFSDPRELVMDILKHGRHCEVLGPQSLRRLVAQEASQMAEKYL